MNAPLIQAAAPSKRSHVSLNLRPRSTVARMRALKAARPVTRGDCVGGIRPCPWMTCRHHLVHAQQGFKSMTADAMLVRLEAMPETCALDVADRGGEHLETVGNALDLTRERVRQIEAASIRRLQELGLKLGDYFADDGAEGDWHDEAPVLRPDAEVHAERRVDMIRRCRQMGLTWRKVAERLIEAGIKTRRGNGSWYASAAREAWLSTGEEDPAPPRTADAIAEVVADRLGAVWVLAVMRALHVAGRAPRSEWAHQAVRNAVSATGFIRGWVIYEVGGETVRAIWAPAGLNDDEIERLCGARPKGVDDE